MLWIEPISESKCLVDRIGGATVDAETQFPEATPVQVQFLPDPLSASADSKVWPHI